MKTSSLVSYLSASVLAIAIGACGASDPAPTTPAPAADPAPAAASDNETDPLDTCTATFVRQRECQETFLPALVDLRVRLDVPAGIAATDASDGRDALLAIAREEYAVDSTDDAIGRTCQSIVSTMPADQLEAGLTKATECLAASSCDEFVPCVISLTEEQLATQK